MLGLPQEWDRGVCSQHGWPCTVTAICGTGTQYYNERFQTKNSSSVIHSTLNTLYSEFPYIRTSKWSSWWVQPTVQDYGEARLFSSETLNSSLYMGYCACTLAACREQRIKSALSYVLKHHQKVCSEKNTERMYRLTTSRVMHNTNFRAKSSWGTYTYVYTAGACYVYIHQ